MNKLKKLLQVLGIAQAEMARTVGISAGTFADILNHGKLPNNWDVLRNRIELELKQAGAKPAVIKRALTPSVQKNAQGDGNHQGRGVHQNPLKHPNNTKGHEMLLQKQALTPAARQHFAIPRDPFTDDVQAADDVFLTPDARYVRESMWACAKHGGMLAVVGESGAGKSTLRRDFIDRVNREQASIIVIEPYVLAMEENDMKGKTLKSAQIAEAIIASINPLEKPKRSSEARFRQLHSLLKESNRSGNRHVLIIEEAHCLPTATLKHLKRFFELEDGFKKLLSIILIGQQELKMKLSDKNTEVREVVQRCEVAELQPLDNYLQEYLAFKFKRVGIDVAAIFESGAVDALRAKLTFNTQAPRAQGRAYAAQTTSLLYPLAVANVVTAALNMAVGIGAPVVSADIVKEV